MSMHSTIQRIVVATLAFAIFLYGADYLVLKIKASHDGGASAFGTVSVEYGTPMKDGRVEIFTDQTQTVTCVNSMFPHMGYNPCWYVRKNQMQLIGAALVPFAAPIEPVSPAALQYRATSQSQSSQS